MSATITPSAAIPNVQALQPVQAVVVVAARIGDGLPQNLVLQPGTIVQAQVADVSAGGQVRIALAGVVIDALSDLPLTIGASLRLAVSQANDGVMRLSIVPQDGARVQGAGVADALVVASNPNLRGAGAATIDAPLSSGAGLKQAAASPSSVIASSATLSPEAAQRSAVTQALMQAVQSAAPRQQSLAPLFANVAALAQGAALPASVQQAAVALMALRTKFDDGLSAQQIRQAVARSGLFLESNLAAQTSAASSGGQQATPDLKAALLVLRETLALWRDESGAQAANPMRGGVKGEAQQTASSSLPPGDGATGARGGIDAQGARVHSPSLAPDAMMDGENDADAATSSASVQVQGKASGKPDSLMHALDLAARTSAAFKAEGLQAFAAASDEMIAVNAQEIAQAEKAALRQSQTHTDDNRAPPPLRAGATSAQAIAMPTLSADDAPHMIARQLLDETDGALARQTLLQAASLPDANDQGARAEAGPRWQFEIPFATPQGTAMAHFEVARDAPDQQVEAAQPVWRVRFSIAMEPAGPVHVSVVYNGERTHVRMWAERDDTAARLRDQSGALAQALRNAELDPGEIIVGEGVPPRPRSTKPSGVFLDRAT